MKAGWAASGKIKDASAAIQQLAPTEKTWYDTGRAAAVTKYSEAQVAQAEAFNDMTDAQQSAWINANPGKYTTIKAINKLIFKDKPATAGKVATATTGAGGYTEGRANAVARFGESDVALAETVNDMEKAKKSAWIKANPAK